MNKKYAISWFLLLLFLTTLVSWKTEKVVTVTGLPYQKCFTPEGNEIPINAYETVTLKSVSFVRQVGYLDSWWILDNQNDSNWRAKQYEREKIPAKNQVILDKSRTFHFVLPNALSGVFRKKEFFVSKKETRMYQTKYGFLILDITKTVFPPSEQGAEHFVNLIRINPGEKVIDVGTGAGILGIAAAKAGGIVAVTDTSSDAILLTKQNAVKNGVSVKVSIGSYFADFKDEKFDVIIANLPQEILPSVYAQKIGNLSETIDGGNDGTEVIIPFLELLPRCMHCNSRAYVMTYSQSSHCKTLKAMTKNFNVRLIDVKTVPVKEYVDEHENFFKHLNNAGIISLFKRDDKWHATVMVFELKLKNIA